MSVLLTTGVLLKPDRFFQREIGSASFAALRRRFTQIVAKQKIRATRPRRHSAPLFRQHGHQQVSGSQCASSAVKRDGRACISAFRQRILLELVMEAAALFTDYDDRIEVSWLCGPAFTTKPA